MSCNRRPARTGLRDSSSSAAGYRCKARRRGGHGGRGEAVPPHAPPSEANHHLSRPCGCAAHEQDEKRLFLGGLRPPKPSRGRGYGGTWFPHGHVRRSCVWRTTPNEHDLGARASRPRHGSAGTVTVPSLTLPRWGPEPGSSPQRGEAGRGAEPCERWSPQPSMRLRRPRTG